MKLPLFAILISTCLLLAACNTVDKSCLRDCERGIEEARCNKDSAELCKRFNNTKDSKCLDYAYRSCVSVLEKSDPYKECQYYCSTGQFRVQVP